MRASFPAQNRPGSFAVGPAVVLTSVAFSKGTRGTNLNSQVVILRRRECSFSKNRRFACTGAPVLRALRPSSFQLHRTDERFTCTGGIFFGGALSALAPGWPRLGFRGARPGRADSSILSFLSLYVNESVPFGESSHFACTGA